MYKPYPLTPDIVSVLKDTYQLATDEEVSQPAIFRDFVDKSCASIDASPVDKQDLEIEFNHIKVNISILRPVGSEQKILPVILYLHGGGWVIGSYNTHRILTNELVNLLDCCVIFVHYSCSPEVKYPFALEECYAALCWIQGNAASIYATAEGLVVSGDSAGGNLAAALTILAKQRDNQGISYQVLYYPVTDVNFETESYIENQNDAFLPRTTMQYFWDAYLEGSSQYTNPTAVPMACENLQNLPPALIITAEEDVLRTEAELYGKRLTQAGVNTLSVRYIGVGHGFLTMTFLNPQAIAAINQTMAILKSHWNTKSKL